MIRSKFTCEIVSRLFENIEMTMKFILIPDFKNKTLSTLSENIYVLAVNKSYHRKGRQACAKNAVLNKFFANFARETSRLSV